MTSLCTSARGDGLAAACEAFERTLIEMTLKRCQGNRRAAARELGIGYSSLFYKLNKYSLG